MLREKVRIIFNAIFLVIALPLVVFYNLESFILGREKSFQGMSQLLSLFPGLAGVYLRRAFYMLSLKKSSWDCYIGFGTIFSHFTTEIGKNVYIGTNCTIGDVSLSDYVTIGSNADIMNRGKQHYIDKINVPIQKQGGEYPKVYIGEDAWIGNSAVVMADIGKKSVIGAGSVVVEDIEDYTVAVGNPARMIRKRS